MTPLPAGSTIGIIGGGQLGRMLAMAAARLGYRTVDPGAAGRIARRRRSPTGRSSPPMTTPAALAELAAPVRVVTYEFENVPVAAAERLPPTVPVYPPARALEVAQDRLAEKRFLNGIGIPTADFRAVDNDADLDGGAARHSAAAAC